jgi:ABC-type maltose transport system permease subunit
MDAAKIDGAGHYRILITIMIPLARVPLLILWVLTFIGCWNSYNTQYTLLPSMPNLSLALWYFQFDVGNAISWPPIQIAASMIVAAPCLILYFTFQKWFVGNLTMGGLKG